MKKVIKAALITLILTFMITGLALAQDLSAAGYTILSESKSDSSSIFEAEDSEGRKITISVVGEFTDGQIQTVQAISSNLYAIENLSIESLKIQFENGKAVILVKPSAYVVEEIDLAQYMVSGMQFYYTTYLEYNFRMFIENLFVRIQGQFFSIEEFEEKLLSAVENPAAYIQSHDPEYIIRKLAVIDTTLDDLKKTDADANTAYEELKTAHETLQTDYETLQANFDKVRFGLMMLNNRGWFGSIDYIEQEAVAKLVEFKTADSSLTMKDAATKMKDAGFEMTGNEIFLVFAVYFNEFE